MVIYSNLEIYNFISYFFKTSVMCISDVNQPVLRESTMPIILDLSHPKADYYVHMLKDKYFSIDPGTKRVIRHPRYLIILCRQPCITSSR